jgi:diaminopimelate epimerase
VGICFEKWEGLGNDFVLVVAETAIARWGRAEPTAAQVRLLCDRRRGIGADGLLLVGGLDHGSLRMVVHNADGSRPEMCGNGLRCVVGFVATQRSLTRGELVVQTDAGPRRCRFERTVDGAFEAEVEMGAARLGPTTALEHRGRSISFRRVYVGNPHAVTFEPCPDELVDEIGQALDRATPGGCNVGFCRTTPAATRLDLTVWERGVGRTLGCGTGACAAAAVAVSEGAAAAGQPLDVHLPGGALRITVAAESLEVRLEGPARRVFRGELVSDAHA